ncbi:MAG TPA: UDP-N-acetylmuramoyl-tripeptide--D-alanyl-D-alanine ligase [Limnobacter sp.]|uniref:UDP-N-acetylmuramoyl-tripeptide--D-alanyl-D- alanine ligase n=1 Tax=Limnobacter sp. TaxID=2003368 RepID=UPI002E36F59D|nr:UDP-N-acetylmuramoyl-tripeptide--D-alanyl-D-alanine ligase [Limnobacter sp.]HEX5485772.1 UDP-N-acetylmuramoyl-tripeptide--D-alanyl-D-alanine ligase [Limnobacter sp.]
MTSMNWSFQAINQALQPHLISAEVSDQGVITHIQTDSRQVKAGDLFVCLRGERFDAHEFAPAVIEAGAAGLVVERPLDIPVPQWIVMDTRLALGALAAEWRRGFDLPVLGVVGSNGKTTSKEMLAAICSAHCGADHVLVTQGNLNNEIGVPLTLFRLRANHQMAVVEMGMNHPGEIAYLASLVQPDVVLLTNAQREHQEFMKSVKAVAEENGQAFGALPEEGCAVFPAGTDFDSLWLGMSKGSRFYRFGRGGDCWFNAGQAPNGSLVLESPLGSVDIRPSFVGEHNRSNASGAAAAAIAAGCTIDDVRQGLEAFQPVWGRMQVVKNDGEMLLINDAYNANPDSVNAAIQVLSTLPSPTLLVLGDMGEVGDQSVAFHQEVGENARNSGINKLFALGTATKASVKSFGADGRHFSELDELLTEIKLLTSQQRWSVLVKGSRFMKMERVVDAFASQKTVNHGGAAHVA